MSKWADTIRRSEALSRYGFSWSEAVAEVRLGQGQSNALEAELFTPC